MKHADRIPYVFILDYLAGVDITIKPMFGCYGIYAGGKLCLFLVSRNVPLIPNGRSEQNGIYVATTTDCIDSLTIDFPGSEFDRLKEKKAWIYLADTAADFEPYAIKACEMISAFDARIGR